MIMRVIGVALACLAVGFLSQLAQRYLQTEYLNIFLSENLITILIALLAINSATAGIVLTKIRELVESHGNEQAFTSTKNEMKLSVREQIVLVVLSVVLLTISSSGKLAVNADLALLLNSTICGIFFYSLYVLYDTAIGVMVIIDFKLNE